MICPATTTRVMDVVTLLPPTGLKFAATGTVELLCGATKVTVPTVLWTPSTITFSVPTLPTCSGTWQVHTMSLTDDCTFGLPAGTASVSDVYKWAGQLSQSLQDFLGWGGGFTQVLPEVPCDVPSLKSLVEDGWQIGSNPGPGGSLEPGQLLQVQLFRANNNVLTDAVALSNAGNAVEFGLFAGKTVGGVFTEAQSGEVEDVSGPLSSGPSFKPILPGTPVQLRMLPAVVSDESKAATGDTTWTIQVRARVTLPACGPTQLIVTNMGFDIVQKALRVPTVGMFFEFTNLVGNCFVMTPSTSMIPGVGNMIIDASRSPTAAPGTVNAICGRLDAFRLAAAALSAFAGIVLPSGPVPIPGPAVLAALADACATLRTDPMPVIDGTGSASDLGERIIKVGFLFWGWQNWYKAIASCLILGAPAGLGFDCFIDTNFQLGAWAVPLRLRLPLGAVLGTIPNLSFPGTSPVQLPFQGAPLGPASQGINPTSQPSPFASIASMRVV